MQVVTKLLLDPLLQQDTYFCNRTRAKLLLNSYTSMFAQVGTWVNAIAQAYTHRRQTMDLEFTMYEYLKQATLQQQQLGGQPGVCQFLHSIVHMYVLVHTYVSKAVRSSVRLSVCLYTRQGRWWQRRLLLLLTELRALSLSTYTLFTHTRASFPHLSELKSPLRSRRERKSLLLLKRRSERASERTSESLAQQRVSSIETVKRDGEEIVVSCESLPLLVRLNNTFAIFFFLLERPSSVYYPNIIKTDIVYWCFSME